MTRALASGVAYLLESVLGLFKAQGFILSSEGKGIFPRLQAVDEQYMVEVRAMGRLRGPSCCSVDSLCLLTRGLDFSSKSGQ